MTMTVVVKTVVINCYDFKMTGFGSPARRAFFASGETNSSPFRFCLAWLIRTWWQRFASDIYKSICMGDVGLKRLRDLFNHPGVKIIITSSKT
jgi:hypothetical protein